MTTYIAERNYSTRIALEPKPNEPAATSCCRPSVHALAFIESLDSPELVGVNPSSRTRR